MIGRRRGDESQIETGDESETPYVVSYNDDSGALYGCLELAKRIREAGKLPDHLKFHDNPVMKLRGTCIGMQKTFIMPGRHVYEYPYTPDLFPWFYDKQLWQEYLDFLVGQPDEHALSLERPSVRVAGAAEGLSLCGRGAGRHFPKEPGDIPLARRGMRQARHLAGADVLQHHRFETVCRDEWNFHATFRAHAAHRRLHAQIHRRIREAIPERRPDGLSRRGVARHAEPVGLVHQRDFARRVRRHERGWAQGGTAGGRSARTPWTQCHHPRRGADVHQYFHRIEIQRRIAHHLGAARQTGGPSM